MCVYRASKALAQDWFVALHPASDPALSLPLCTRPDKHGVLSWRWLPQVPHVLSAEAWIALGCLCPPNYLLVQHKRKRVVLRLRFNNTVGAWSAATGRNLADWPALNQYGQITRVDNRLEWVCGTMSDVAIIQIAYVPFP